MSKTYLQLVNEVSKKLRRATYTSVSQDTNAVFMAQAINQAKRLVEDRWKWNQLWRDITFTSAAAVYTYDTGAAGGLALAPDVTNDRSFLLYDEHRRPLFWDITTPTNGCRMRECTRSHAEHIRNLQNVGVSIPDIMTVYQNGDGLTVLFPYPPLSARNYLFKAYVPQEELLTATEHMDVPWRPVVLAATALCCEERGEELGMTAARWWDEYEMALGAAIGHDSKDEDMTLVAD